MVDWLVGGQTDEMAANNNNNDLNKRAVFATMEHVFEYLKQQLAILNQANASPATVQAAAFLPRLDLSRLGLEKEPSGSGNGGAKRKSELLAVKSVSAVNMHSLVQQFAGQTTGCMGANAINGAQMRELCELLASHPTNQIRLKVDGRRITVEALTELIGCLQETDKFAELDFSGKTSYGRDNRDEMLSDLTKKSYNVWEDQLCSGLGTITPYLMRKKEKETYSQTQSNPSSLVSGVSGARGCLLAAKRKKKKEKRKNTK